MVQSMCPGKEHVSIIDRWKDTKSRMYHLNIFDSYENLERVATTFICYTITNGDSEDWLAYRRWNTEEN